MTSSPARGGLRDRIARNVVWNWAGTAVDLAAGFIVAPFLVHRLGAEGYGLWIVIASLSGYFGLVDLGLRGSVARHLALERSNASLTGTSRILSTSLAILCGLTLLTVAVTVFATAMFDHVFNPPVELVDETNLALLLVGINLAISLPLNVFDGNLWAAQRFDTLNLVDIPTTLVRVALTFSFIDDSSDIVALAVITLATTVGSGTAKALISFRYDPLLKIHPKYVNRASAKDLVRYGWWSFVLATARMTKSQLTPLLIGALVGIPFVTPFSIARRLQDYAHRVLWTATGVLTPVATHFHARSEANQQQRLFIEGGKYSTVVAIYFLAYFACLGRSLIGLWMGPPFAYVAVFLMVLTVGELVQMTQSVTSSIVLGTAQHKPLAWFTLAEALTTVISIGLMARFGLLAICVSQAAPQLIFSGFATLFYGCRVTGVSLSRYLREAIFPALLVSSVPVMLLVSLTLWRLPSTWAGLVSYSLGYTFVLAVCCWGVLQPVRANTSLKTLAINIFNR